jgi:tetratricopeptide (TPR) repeat protein
VRALLELEHLPEALAKATSLRPEVEATGYKPLVADLLQDTGLIHSRLGSHAQAAADLEEAFFAAEGGRDDVTAVEAATTLTFVLGNSQGRYQDGLRWGRIATAILDRLGPGHPRLRAWTLHDQAQLLMGAGDLEHARPLFEQAIALKEKALGRDHPDVSISLDGLAQTLKLQGQLAASLATEDRAIEILTKHGILPYRELNNRAETLVALHRYAEAEASFARALQIMEHDLHAAETNLAYPLAGLGEVKLATGHAADAVPLLERALAAREQNESDANLTADTQLTLARALWESAADRKRALALATKARATYASHGRPQRVQDVVAWLAAHSAQRP